MIKFLNRRKVFFSVFLVFCFLFLTSLALANEVSGYIWSENIGWIKMSGPNYGVDYNIENDSFSGYGWSENIGWVRFDDDWAKVVSADNVSGWDGLIKLKGDNFGVDYFEDGVRGCYLSGWGWGSDVTGWVKFTGNRFTTRVSPCQEVPEEIVPGEVSCSLSASPSRLIRPRRDTSLTWACQNAESCNLSDFGSVDANGGTVEFSIDRTRSFTLTCSNSASSYSTSVQVQVFKPTYCEIIPYGPGC